MPHKDPIRRQEAMRRWRRNAMDAGYGKWLYQRRKLRFDDAERFRQAIEDALAALSEEPLTAKATPASTAVDILSRALQESQEAENTLGRWQPDDSPDPENLGKESE